jgi:hypothetical protein
MTPIRAPSDDRLPVLGLLGLAAAGFLTILTEALPAGLLFQMSADLAVSEAMVGQLITAYALGSLIAAIPLTAATRGWPLLRVSGSIWLHDHPSHGRPVLTGGASSIEFRAGRSLNVRSSVTVQGRFLICPERFACPLTRLPVAPRHVAGGHHLLLGSDAPLAARPCSGFGFPDEVYEGPQCFGHLPPARIVEVKAREGFAPVFQHPHQFSGLQPGGDEAFREKGHADPFQSRRKDQIGLIDRDPVLDVHFDRPVGTLEDPPI